MTKYYEEKEYRERLSRIRLERKERLGYLNSIKTREKMRVAKIGNTNRKGKKHPHTEETKIKISQSMSGEKNHQWKGGIKSEKSKMKHNIKYRLWREAVFKRDDWTCQKYKIRGGELHPHHIKNFADYPELRFEVDNGITLSEKAHKEFHKKYGKKNNTREQLEEFFKS